jgi:hypothetical protein
MRKKDVLTSQEGDSEEVLCLIRAHALMNHKGVHWIKGHFHKKMLRSGWRQPETCYCLSGGVNAAAPNDPALQDRVKRRLIHVVKHLYPQRSGALGEVRSREHIYNFNDHPGTNWKDVEKVIVETIKREREAA